MLVLAFVASAVLEIVGIGLVMRDVLADRARRKTLLRKYPTVFAGSRHRSSHDDTNLASDPKRLVRRVLENERSLQALETNTERADELVHGIVVELVSPGWWRLVGPGFVVAGIVAGMVANICAST